MGGSNTKPYSDYDDPRQERARYLAGDARRQKDYRGQRPVDPRFRDPRLADPRYRDPRLVDPVNMDRRHADPRLFDPRQVDPRVIESRQTDQRYIDPRLADHRALDPRLGDPRNAESRQGEIRYTDQREADPRQAAQGWYNGAEQRIDLRPKASFKQSDRRSWYRSDLAEEPVLPDDPEDTIPLPEKGPSIRYHPPTQAVAQPVLQSLSQYQTHQQLPAVHYGDDLVGAKPRKSSVRYGRDEVVQIPGPTLYPMNDRSYAQDFAPARTYQQGVPDAVVNKTMSYNIGHTAHPMNVGPADIAVDVGQSYLQRVPANGVVTYIQPASENVPHQKPLQTERKGQLTEEQIQQRRAADQAYQGQMTEGQLVRFKSTDRRSPDRLPTGLPAGRIDAHMNPREPKPKGSPILKRSNQTRLR